MKILKVNGSILGDYSVSKQITQKIVKDILKGEDLGEVKETNIDDLQLKMLDFQVLEAWKNQDSSDNKVSQHLISDLKNTDILIIGSPMYNFGISAQLKTYFDYVIRVGETFNYSNEGVPVGHVTNIKKAFVVLSRGGFYEKQFTAQEDSIKQMLNFIGIQNIEFIFAEGLATAKKDSTIDSLLNRTYSI